MKNIKDVMEGHEDGVILLTDVYHEKSDDDSAVHDYAKHKEVLQEINSALDFINNANKDAASLHSKIAQKEKSDDNEALSHHQGIRESLQKLKNAKLQNSNEIDKENTQNNLSPVELFLSEMLRPILMQWLDTNLPAIVEREVERAIARIVNSNQ